MSDAPDLEFGVPWAPFGEDRPARRYTALAWVPGFDGGALLVQKGTTPGDRVWILMREWTSWVAEVRAAPVDLSPVVWFFDDPAALDPNA